MKSGGRGSSQCQGTVNARISAWGAYLSRVERGALIRRGALISFFKFRPQYDIVFISSEHKL